MKRIKSLASRLGHHAWVLFTGFKRVLYGTATAGAIGLAIWGFAAVPAEGGYVAVCDFIGATATLVVGLAAVYAQGKVKGKYTKGRAVR